MRSAFYDSEEYRERQSQITKANAQKGVYAHLRKSEHRICALQSCGRDFIVRPADKKRYCTRSCARKVKGKRVQSEETRKKISESLIRKGIVPPGAKAKGRILVPRDIRTCPNEWCRKEFTCERWKKRTFCSAACAAKRPTSPKASRGKSGIRPDISSEINFHSRWEANVARMYSFLGIEWKYEPVTFEIGGHTYTPDFYLPRYDEFLEVKNFWSEYAAKRDRMFRNTNPGIYLRILLRDEYIALQNRYGTAIPNWEFSGNNRAR